MATARQKVLRAGPSGKIVEPSPGVGQLSWNVSGTLDFTLLRAGHPAGLYPVNIAIVVLTAASAGSINLISTWDEPGVGLLSFQWGSLVLTGVPGSGFIAPRHIQSSGARDLTFQIVPVGVTGSPRLYVNVPLSAMLARQPIGVGYPSP